MKFSIIAPALIAVASATFNHGSHAAEETCSVSVVTVTVTETMGHTPSAPTSHAATGPAPYPTAWESSMPVMSAATGTVSGVAGPTASASYTPPPQFTGAASHVQVGGALAAGAFAALFL